MQGHFEGRKAPPRWQKWKGYVRRQNPGSQIPTRLTPSPAHAQDLDLDVHICASQSPDSADGSDETIRNTLRAVLVGWLVLHPEAEYARGLGSVAGMLVQVLGHVHRPPTPPACIGIGGALLVSEPEAEAVAAVAAVAAAEAAAAAAAEPVFREALVEVLVPPAQGKLGMRLVVNSQHDCMDVQVRGEFARVAFTSSPFPLCRSGQHDCMDCGGTLLSAHDPWSTHVAFTSAPCPQQRGACCHLELTPASTH